MTLSNVAKTPAEVRLTTILCFLVAVLEGFDLQVVAVAAPQLRAAMGLSPQQVGIAFSASLIGLAIGAVIGGTLSDRIGRKSTLIASVALLGIFTLLTTATTTFGMFLFVRVLAGIGLGGAMPTLIALVAEISGHRRTTAVVTTAICGQPTGGVIVALLGKIIIANWGWQSLFVIGGGLTLVIVPILVWGLVETRSTVAASSERARRMPPVEAMFHNKRAAPTLLLWVVFILTLALLSIMLGWMPLLVMAKGFSQGLGLSAIMAANVGGIAGGLLISRVIDNVGVRLPMLILYAAMAGSLYLFAHVTAPGALIPVAAIVGFCVLGAQFSLYGIAPRLYPMAGRGAGVGVAVAMGRIGSVLGPIIFGILVGAGASEASAVLVMVPTALIAGAALLALTIAAGRKLAAEGKATTVATGDIVESGAA